MALQDLTPQLRTRMGRVERLVGLFVSAALLVLLFGFCYYLYHTAQRRGWFLIKAPYFTYLESGTGLKVGDTVKLMGFDAGEITRITAEDPDKPYNVYVEFDIKQPYYGYLWNDSRVKVKSAGLLGSRFLEVTKGGTSGTTNRVFATYHEKNNKLTEIYLDKEGAYTNYQKGSKLLYQLVADEPPAFGDEMDQVVEIARNLLTNKLVVVLSNVEQLISNYNTLALTAQPSVTNLGAITTNLALITGNLRDPKGSFGDWLIPADLHVRLNQTLGSADKTFTSTETNLTALVANLNRTLDNLADITGNLNAQVATNTNLVKEVSDAIIHADELMQGLKRHWLLRSAFKPTKTNAPPASVPPPRR